MTEQPQVERTLRESEEKYRALFEGSNDAILVADPETWRFVDCNQKAEALTGYSRTELLSMTVGQLSPAERQPGVERFKQEYDGEERRDEWELITKAGKRVLIEISARGITIGEKFYIQGILRDVTERKRIETALRESEELHRITLSNISDAIFITDDSGSFTYICPNVTKIFGYTTAEVKALGNISEFLEDNLFTIEALEARQELKNIEREITDKAGHKHSLLINIKRVSIKGGTILYTCRDVTQRLQSEQALAENQRRLQALFDHSLDAILLADDQGHYVDANPAACTLTGYSREELLNMTFFDLTPAENHVAAEKIWQQFKESVQLTGEYEILCKDGSILETEFRAISNMLPGLHLSMIRDITRRKQVERELRHYGARMEALAEISKALAEAGLDRQAVLDTIARQVAGTLGDACVIALFSEDEMELTPVAFDHPQPEARAVMAQVLTTSPSPSDDERTAEILKTGRPIFIPVVPQEQIGEIFLPEYEAYLEQVGVHSMLIVPLRVDGQVIGTLGVTRDKPGRSYTAGDEAFLQNVADRAALMIVNARLFEAEKHRSREAETLRQASAAVAATLHQPEITQRILEQLARMVPYETASVQLLRDGYTEVVDGRGWSDGTRVVGQQFPIPDDNPNTVVIQGRRPLILGDVRTEYPSFHEAWHRHIQSWLGVPLIFRDRIVGMLTVDSSEPDRFTPEDARLVAAFGTQVAIALENARFFEAEQEARQMAETLQEANLALSESLVLDIVLEKLLDYLHKLVPYHSATVMLLEAGRRLAVYLGRGYENWTEDDAVRRLTFDPRHYPNLQKVLTDQESFIIPDTRNYRGWQASVGEIDLTYIRSWLGVPLMAGGELIGLYTIDRDEPGFFTGKHLELAETLAAQAAVAIQNAQLFRQVQVGSEQLQELSRRLLEVQERERRHIARELHDEVGQILTGLKLLLDVSFQVPSDKFNSNLSKAQGLVNELMDRVDELSLDLRPSMLDDLGLLPTLLWHFERYTEQTNVQVRFNHRGLEGQRFAPEVETAAYRIVQEALTNVARHADVQEVIVRVWTSHETLGLQIEDQGSGFERDRAGVDDEASGLSGMRERATLLGGHLAVDSTPGAGTVLTAELPLSEPGEGSEPDGRYRFGR